MTVPGKASHLSRCPTYRGCLTHKTYAKKAAQLIEVSHVAKSHLSRFDCSIGAVPQTLLGLRPPDSLLRRVCGRAPSGFGAVLQLPAYMIQSSQPVRSVESSNRQISSTSSRQVCPNPVRRVGCEGPRNKPERSEGERNEAEDRSPPGQTGFRQIWRRSGETKPVA